MKEYSINLRKDGSAVIARNFWNPDHSLEALRNKPFLFEVGQKVVDIFSNVVTIKEIIKHTPSEIGKCPEWNLLVQENRNCYRYVEIAGIYVREISSEELKFLIESDIRENITKEIKKLMEENTQKSDGSEFYGGRASAFGVVYSLITSILNTY